MVERGKSWRRRKEDTRGLRTDCKEVEEILRRDALRRLFDVLRRLKTVLREHALDTYSNVNCTTWNVRGHTSPETYLFLFYDALNSSSGKANAQETSGKESLVNHDVNDDDDDDDDQVTRSTTTSSISKKSMTTTVSAITTIESTTMITTRNDDNAAGQRRSLRNIVLSILYGPVLVSLGKGTYPENLPIVLISVPIVCDLCFCCGQCFLFFDNRLLSLCSDVLTIEYMKLSFFFFGRFSGHLHHHLGGRFALQRCLPTPSPLGWRGRGRE